MRELGRFYEMLLGRGSYQGRRLLLPQTVDLFTSRQREGMVDATFKHVIDWGLGFILNSNRYGADTVPYGYDATPAHGGLYFRAGGESDG